MTDLLIDFLADIADFFADLWINKTVDKIADKKKEVTAKRAFCCSLCYEGLRGGAIAVTDKGVVYRNDSLTIPERFKKLTVPFENIERAEKSPAAFFPAVTLILKNDERIKFVIFNRKGFLNELSKHGIK